jgi:hypothetical protein
MDVTIIVPVESSSDSASLAACLRGIFAQRYDEGRIETILVRYGHASAGTPTPVPVVDRPLALDVRELETASKSPYAARNLAAAIAGGAIFLFTEPGCVPDPGWVAGHVARMRDGNVTVGVGHVAPFRTTRLLESFIAYEQVRDAWVFAGSSWGHYFGRPKNMAVSRRRFETHGPFVEVARGADSKFVQKVAREISCDEVAHVSDAIVRQQSIEDLQSCFRDRFGHGHALQTHQSAHAAPVALRDRVALFRETRKRKGYGPLDTLRLFFVLALGVWVFRVGEYAGALSRRRNRY